MRGPYRRLRSSAGGGFLQNAETTGLDWSPGLRRLPLLRGGRLAATKTAPSAARRTAPGKANGADRTATSQPSSVNGAGVEPAVLEEILEALVAARGGDLSRRLL